MLTTNDVAKVYDTILSIPGMNETVKISMNITRPEEVINVSQKKTNLARLLSFVIPTISSYNYQIEVSSFAFLIEFVLASITNFSNFKSSSFQTNRARNRIRFEFKL